MQHEFLKYNFNSCNRKKYLNPILERQPRVLRVRYFVILALAGSHSYPLLSALPAPVAHSFNRRVRRGAIGAEISSHPSP